LNDVPEFLVVDDLALVALEDHAVREKSLHQGDLLVQDADTTDVEVLVVEVEGGHDEVEHDDVHDEGVEYEEECSRPVLLVGEEHGLGEAGGGDAHDHAVEALQEALVVEGGVVVRGVVHLGEVEEYHPRQTGEGQQRRGEDYQHLRGLDGDVHQTH